MKNIKMKSLSQFINESKDVNELKKIIQNAKEGDLKTCCL